MWARHNDDYAFDIVIPVTFDQSKYRMRLSEISLAIPEFVDYLQQSCDNHQVGTHFEEGGCFAMALALAEHFQQIGTPVQLGWSSTSNHACVIVSGKHIDWQGETKVPDAIRLDRSDFMKVVRQCKMASDLPSDLEIARSVIEGAEYLAQNALE